MRRTRKEDRSPPDPVSLPAVGSEGENDQAISLPTRIARYSSAKARAVAMGDYLATQSGERAHVARSKLATCGNYLHFRHYFTVGKILLHSAVFCRQHLICPLCAIRRGSKTLAAYLARFYLVQAQHPELLPYLVTFTVLNGPDLTERFKHLSDSFKLLQGRRRKYLSGCRGAPFTESSKIQGAVGTYEVTEKGKGWHPHIHMVALCASPPDQQALRNEWEGITGDSFMVDVRPFLPDQDPALGFMEVLKYALKFGDLSLSDNWHAAQALSRKRLVFSFGLFRGVVVPESMVDEPLEDLPYFDLFYRWFQSGGYSLTGESPPSS